MSRPSKGRREHTVSVDVDACAGADVMDGVEVPVTPYDEPEALDTMNFNEEVNNEDPNNVECLRFLV